MDPILNAIYSNYVTMGQSTVSPSKTTYVNVDPTLYQGSWDGTYSNGVAFKVTISDVQGFRAKARFQSGATVQSQNVLIKDGAFRVGDSKFTLIGLGQAQVKTVVTNPANGSTKLNTGNATKST